MKYQFIKIFQVTITAFITILQPIGLAYPLCIIIAILPKKYHWISSSISIIANIICIGEGSFSITLLICCILLIFLAWWGNTSSNQNTVAINNLVMYLLICLALCSARQNLIFKYLHLAIFYLCLLLAHYTSTKWIKLSCWLIIAFFSIEIILLIISRLFSILSFIPPQPENWQLICTPITLCIATFIIKYEQFQIISQQMINQGIEMKQYNSNQSKSNNNILQQPLLQNQLDKTIKSQSQFLNILLIIPFCCFNMGVLQIIPYLYFIFTQYNITSSVLYFLTLLCLLTITVLQSSSQLYINLLLRFCLVFFVDKNLQIGWQMASMVSSLWLKTSFIFVLIIMFWFSLKTVNIFHLGLICILLLFITKNNQNHQTISFRHKYWIYLLTLFNFFLILRLLYEIIVIHYSIEINPLINAALALFGFSYVYTSSLNMFNCIPMIISASLGFQYLTYCSRIYQIHSHQPILPAYREILNHLLRIATILYYKLIPWVSYAIILITLLPLQFSCSSGILLLWILLILTIQILLPNQLNSYCRLYWLWLIYSRINALRIILRYIFEFAKFPTIYHVLHKLPFFQILIRYEQFLGLMIRQGSYVYFKTISKFQIMISLDLASIFIAFLLIQYYQILITYHTIKKNNQQQGNYVHYNVENQRIIQLYTSYIDFKLTLWFTTLNTLIRKFSKIYITLFYPLICIIICLKQYISMLLLLVIILIHYLGLNTIYYETYIKPLTAQKMLNLLIKWRTTNIKQQAVQLIHNLSRAILHVKQYQLSQHNKLRKYLITIIMTCLSLCYFSRILLTQEITSLISEQNTIISLRWALYLNGTSIECGQIINIYLILLVMLVIDLKCCGFLQKYYFIRSQALQPSQQRKQKSKLESQLSNISQKSENNGLQLLQNSNVDEQKSKVKQHRQQTFKYIEMKVSILFSINKIVQRSFVLILILASIIEDHHPFGIIYLLWAVILNFLGPISILSLSRVLIIMLLLEYVMLLMNYWDVSLTSLPNTQMNQYQNRTLWSYLVSPQWQQYIKFGDNIYEIIVLIISITLLISYQVYFIILHHNWLYILKLLDTKLSLTTIQYKIYHYSKQIYQYCLIYSPLCLTTICLAVYFLDFTTTNLFLTIISILFLFKSFLIEDYANSRLFWKFYFMLLQLLIVIFMVLYELLNIPMYHSYCNPILCSSEQFHTKISKAILLFILQIGIDLMKSQQFVTALKQLKSSLSDASKFSRLAIAYKHNDSKIAHKFRRIAKQKQLKVNMKQVQNFLNEYKNNSTFTLNNRKQIIMNSQSWLDTILNIMPTLVDSSMILTFQQAKQLIINENYRWIHNRNILQEELYTINQTYMNVFADIDDNNVLISMLQQQIQINNSKILKHSISRKSFIDDLMPFESSQLCLSKIEQQTSKQYQFQQKQSRQIKNTILQQQNSMSEQKIKSKSQKDFIKQQKHQLLYLLILDSVLSNWSYLTYILLILLHIRNLGLLTLPFPIIVFCFGVICSYQPGKLVWRVLFLWTLVPITIKFTIQIGILQLSHKQQYILIGDNISSIMLEYLVLLFILIQCLILKAINLYNEDVVQVECMRIALIRNIINHNSQKQKDMLQLMLKDANYIPEDHKQFIFGNSQCKPGYDYSTLLTSLQLIILVYIFLFYDNMAIRKKVTFYQMIEYNQFKAGMVSMILIQLFFLLASRFLISVNLSEYSQKWNFTLFLKYSLMVLNIIYVQVTVLIFFPFNSNNFTNSTYISLFYILNAFYILLTSLQIKYGIDQESKGFMDRYTWYNGFIYMAFRAIPFLFEFKVFSDWTSTRTSLRLFDWIKLQQIFGRIYIAKCNSLFLQGKQIGSKIQWWKKLLMGYPLLLAIILLLFGPLVLFSSLNPLASTNEVTAGYLQLSLKINHTNQYPLYTNSHITDIDALVPTNAEIQMLKAHDLDPQAAQLLQLEEYSDQYWQISEGSYYKLLEQPLNSHYQLLIRIKFERNLTGSTPLYTLNSYTIPSSDISHFKEVLKGHQSMIIANFMDQFLRLDNNNGLHILGTNKHSIIFFAKESQRANKKYWMIESGLDIRMLSDRYTRAIFGYSVMSFYISIILVIANYFRFLFQGSAHTIILSDIPMADSLLTIYNAIYQARRNFNIQQQEILFWTLIDILRSPDTIKAMTGNYLQARMETKKNN